MAPVTFAGPSTLDVGWPMVVYDIFFPSSHKKLVFL
jgi:hypothetical protein